MCMQHAIEWRSTKIHWVLLHGIFLEILRSCLKRLQCKQKNKNCVNILVTRRFCWLSLGWYYVYSIYFEWLRNKFRLSFHRIGEIWSSFDCSALFRFVPLALLCTFCVSFLKRAKTFDSENHFRHFASQCILFIWLQILIWTPYSMQECSGGRNRFAICYYTRKPVWI